MHKTYMLKLEADKKAMQAEHVELRKNVNRVMLRRPVKNEEADKTVVEKFRLSERINAENQLRKKDTSLLGS